MVVIVDVDVNVAVKAYVEEMSIGNAASGGRVRADLLKREGQQQAEATEQLALAKFHKRGVKSCNHSRRETVIFKVSRPLAATATVGTHCAPCGHWR